MSVRRIAAGVGVAAVAATTGLFATPAFATATTTIQLDTTGMTASNGTSLLCSLPLNGTIAVQPGTSLKFTKGLLSGLLTIAASEKVTIAPVDAAGKAGTPIVKDKALDYATTLNTGTYALSWTALNVLGVVAGNGSGTLVVSPNATTDCKLAVAIPTPSVSVPGLDPVNSVVNSLVGGVASAVNSAVAPVNSAINQVTSALPAIPGVGASKPGGGTSKPVNVPNLGSYTPWTPSLAEGVVPNGYGDGSGAAFDYVAPQSGQGLDLTNRAETSVNQAVVPGFTAAPIPTTSQGTVDLAASKNRGILDSLSGVFVVLAFASLSGAIAYYVRNFLMSNGGRFI